MNQQHFMLSQQNCGNFISKTSFWIQCLAYYLDSGYYTPYSHPSHRYFRLHKNGSEVLRLQMTMAWNDKIRVNVCAVPSKVSQRLRKNDVEYTAQDTVVWIYRYLGCFTDNFQQTRRSVISQSGTVIKRLEVKMTLT